MGRGLVAAAGWVTGRWVGATELLSGEGEAPVCLEARVPPRPRRWSLELSVLTLPPHPSSIGGWACMCVSGGALPARVSWRRCGVCVRSSCAQGMARRDLRGWQSCCSLSLLIRISWDPLNWKIWFEEAAGPRRVRGEASRRPLAPFPPARSTSAGCVRRSSHPRLALMRTRGECSHLPGRWK